MRLLIVLSILSLTGCSDETLSSEPETKSRPMELHPDFPIVKGNYQMTKSWSVNLPTQFNQRIEDGDLVLWRPGFTIWATVWNNDESESQQERLKSIQDDSSPGAFGEITEISDRISRYAYRLREDSEDNREPAFYGFAIGARGHVQMAIYFDSPDDLAEAEEIWRSINEKSDKEN